MAGFGPAHPGSNPGRPIMIAVIVILTIVIELMSIYGRAVYGQMKKTKTVRRIYKKLNLKVYIHHGYVGLLLSLLYIPFPKQILLIIGLPLLLSDIIHHFITLPIWVGKTEFP